MDFILKKSQEAKCSTNIQLMRQIRYKWDIVGENKEYMAFFSTEQRQLVLVSLEEAVSCQTSARLKSHTLCDRVLKTDPGKCCSTRSGVIMYLALTALPNRSLSLTQRQKRHSIEHSYSSWKWQPQYSARTGEEKKKKAPMYCLASIEKSSGGRITWNCNKSRPLFYVACSGGFDNEVFGWILGSVRYKYKGLTAWSVCVHHQLVTSPTKPENRPLEPWGR